MSHEHTIADHWAKGAVWARIVSVLKNPFESLDALTVQDLPLRDFVQVLRPPSRAPRPRSVPLPRGCVGIAKIWSKERTRGLQAASFPSRKMPRANLLSVMGAK
jgi:hypothetical protein